MKGQVFAITLVVMSGVATFIMFISTMDSLNLTRNTFYRDYNFADVFVNLKRAPESLKDKIKRRSRRQSGRNPRFRLCQAGYQRLSGTGDRQDHLHPR